MEELTKDLRSTHYTVYTLCNWYVSWQICYRHVTVVRRQALLMGEEGPSP